LTLSPHFFTQYIKSVLNRKQGGSERFLRAPFWLHLCIGATLCCGIHDEALQSKCLLLLASVLASSLLPATVTGARGKFLPADYALALEESSALEITVLCRLFSTIL
jgi:hypothetical protein